MPRPNDGLGVDFGTDQSSESVFSVNVSKNSDIVDRKSVDSLENADKESSKMLF